MDGHALPGLVSLSGGLRSGTTWVQIPEEIVETFGGHLSLAQVHAALAYNYANPAEIDAELEAETRETESLAREYLRSQQT